MIMTEGVKTLDLTDDEITLLFWMAGTCYLKIPKVFEESYERFMKKLAEVSVHRGG